jgi:hypothetical protein
MTAAPADRALPTRAAFAGVVLMAAASACASLAGLDEFPPPDATASSGQGALGGGGQAGDGGAGARAGSSGSAERGVGAAGGGGGGGGGSGGGCPRSAYGPAMVALGSYCIDETEVTGAQYLQWLATSPSTGGQPSYCEWNDTFAPAGALVASDAPIAGVDWCDAYAFCLADNKRLCGKIGGGSVGYDSGWIDPDQSQWFSACTQDGVTTYPYGSTYEASTCNGYDASQGGTVAVGSFGGCRGTMSPWDQVVDLSGNASEWEDSCSAETGAADFCHRRGGASGTMTPASLACDAAGGTAYTRNGYDVDLGFRCCAELQ